MGKIKVKSYQGVTALLKIKITQKPITYHDEYHFITTSSSQNPIKTRAPILTGSNV